MLLPLLIAAASGASGLLTAPETETFSFELEVRNVERVEVLRSYNAVIERPAEPNGWRVMLLSGSYAVDLDWTVPPSYDDGQGNTVRITIDGEPTTDATTISRVLRERGYTVWRYSAIHNDDQLNAKNPAYAEVSPFEDTIKIARAAYEACNQRDPEGPVVLLGHSLGATRGSWIGADEARVTGFVFLAGAYLSDWTGSTNALPMIIEQEGPDVDGDGVVRGWEAASAEAAKTGGYTDSPELFRNTLEWPIDAIMRSNKPALALFGSLDPISVHGPVLAKRSELEGAEVSVEYLIDRDHQLAKSEDGLTSAIDPAAVDRIGDWLDALRAQTIRQESDTSD